MKKLFLAIMILFWIVGVSHADTKVTAMEELDATPETTDILYIIDDPGGDPVSKKITVGNVLAAGHAAVTLDSSATTGGMSITGQEISNQAATNAQPGYATAAQITALEANTAKDTNADHTGEVTGSGALTIADNIIDESNMHISNAPTNDYVLTADSGATGGWKWSAASSGMTYPDAGISVSTGSAWDTSYSIATLGAALEGDMILSNLQGAVTDGQVPNDITITGLSGTNSGDNAANTTYTIGSATQAYDADLDDLADGSLTGSKVGSGISGTNITTGTVADDRIASTIARDSEVSALQADDLVTLSGVAIGSTHLSTFTGDTITDNSTIKTALQELETELEDTVTIDSNGIIVRTGDGTAAARELTEGTGIDITYGDGVSGNPTIAVDATAAEISFSPNGSIEASTVQAAIQEVRDEDNTGTDDQTAAEVSATDEFEHSDATNVQDILDDLDDAIPTVSTRASLNLDTDDSPQFAGVNIGAATDTTLTRSAAGIVAIEGVVMPSISSTNTLTNKRITPRVGTVASSATPTINTDNYDAYSITALAADITSMTTNLSGTPTNFQKLLIRIKDDGTARAITWGASFEAKGIALPTTTTISKVLTVGFLYDTVTSKWGCVGSVEEE